MDARLGRKKQKALLKSCGDVMIWNSCPCQEYEEKLKVRWTILLFCLKIGFLLCAGSCRWLKELVSVQKTGHLIYGNLMTTYWHFNDITNFFSIVFKLPIFSYFLSIFMCFSNWRLETCRFLCEFTIH